MREALVHAEIEFTGLSIHRSSKNSYYEYGYKCSGDALSGYVEKYINLLTSEYPYEIVGQTESKNGYEWRLAHTESIPLESNGKSISYRRTIGGNKSDSKSKIYHICITTHGDNAEIKLGRGFYMDN